MIHRPIKINKLKLNNRLIVSPMCQYSADNGKPSNWHYKHLGSLIDSGASILVLESTAVSREGRITVKDLCLYNNEQKESFKKLIKFLKSIKNIPIFIQLSHSGKKGSSEIPWIKANKPLYKNKWKTISSSPIKKDKNWPSPKEATKKDIKKIINDFEKSAKLALSAGFDGIEIHMAHGYLIHQFLSPISNKRKDKYGSCFENRIRYPLEIFKAIREEISTDYPVGVRFSATDWVENSSWDLGEATQFAMKLKALGCDFFDVSSGGNSPKQEIISGPSYQTGFASHIKNKVGVPTIAVGQINEPLQAESIISTGQADMIAIGRGMLYNPRWAWHAAEVFKKECAYPPQYARAHHSLIGLPIPGNPKSK